MPGWKQRLQQRWEPLQPHVRKYGPSIALNHAVTLGFILLIAVIVGVGPGFRYVPATIGSLWMHINLAPLHMDDAELGFAPLLPAMLIVWWHARRITALLGTSISLRGLRVITALGLGIPLGITVIAWLMLWDASRVFNLSTPNLFVALLSTLLVNGAAVTIGMGPRVWRALLLRKERATWPVESMILAGTYLRNIALAGAVAAIVYAATNFQGLQDAFVIAESTGARIGLSLLSLLYLPNIAIGAAAALQGGEFAIGNGTFSLFAASNVHLPPTPLSAAIPNGPIPYAPYLMVIPAIVAMWTVYSYVRNRTYVEAPVWTAVGSAFAVAFLAFCWGWLGSGVLGVYGNTGPLLWLFAASSAAWLAVPALVYFLWAAKTGAKVAEEPPVEEVPVEKETETATSAANSTPVEDAHPGDTEEPTGTGVEEGSEEGNDEESDEGSEASAEAESDEHNEAPEQPEQSK